FFFPSRRRHTISDRDWSSDVCSSDLEIDENAEDARASRLQARQELESQHLCAVEVVRDQFLDRSQVDLQLDAEGLAQPGCKPAVDRKSVVEGRGVDMRAGAAGVGRWV